MIPQQINLTSDTVTRPTPGMLQAMFAAEVGDDVFGQDPDTIRLEQKLADLFGHEAGLFCPSGTMSNQLAIKAQTQPLDEILLDEIAHIYRYELGGYGFHSGVAIHVMRGHRGIVTPDQVIAGIKPKADWNPNTRMLCLENSINMGGGNYYTFDEIKALTDTARSRGLLTHLDGARLFNVLVETGDDPKAYGAAFNSISICLSKGLGAPVGSVLISDAATIARARHFRKAFGGGMRQTGYLAAAGMYALDHHVNRLREDHQHARQCAAKLRAMPWVAEVLPAPTNIVIFRVADHLTSAGVVQALTRHGIACAPVNDRLVRWVFHLDVTPEMVSRILQLPEDLAA